MLKFTVNAAAAVVMDVTCLLFSTYIQVCCCAQLFALLPCPCPVLYRHRNERPLRSLSEVKEKVVQLLAANSNAVLLSQLKLKFVQMSVICLPVSHDFVGSCMYEMSIDKVAALRVKKYTSPGQSSVQLNCALLIKI